MATMTFSAGILFRRLLEAGWTRRKISYVLDISDAQVSRILNGYNPDVRIGTALAWANALHITLTDLHVLATEGQEGDSLQLPLIDEMYESGFQTQHEEGRFVAAVA